MPSFGKGLCAGARVALGVSGSWVALSASSAWAAMTIGPLNYGGNPVTSGVAYYSSTKADGTASPTLDSGAANAPFHDPDSTYPYGIVNVSKTQNLDPTLASAIAFNVSSSLSTITPPAGQTAVLAIVVGGNGPAGTRYAPIAGLNGSNCALGGCLGIAGLNIADGTTQHTFSVAYTQGTTIRIQLFPKDICVDYGKQAGGQAAFGCDTSSNVQVGDPGGSPAVSGTPLQLTWEIVFIDSTGTVQGQPQDQGSLNLLFQSSTLSFTCPTNLGSSNRYFPGDGSINFNTTGMIPVTPPTGAAPQTQLITVGKIQSSPATPATPILNASFINAPATDDFYARTGFGDQVVIGGFKNTDASGNNTYTIGFMVRDASGMINPTSSTGSVCVQSGIQTSIVNTFLTQTKCFIATAAFRSVDASPVTLLREFRDRILLKTGPGSVFVRWYYHWSPPAAEWLIRNPHVRFPVLTALAPLEGAAWLLLHPAALLAMLLLSGGGLLAWRLGLGLRRMLG